MSEDAFEQLMNQSDPTAKIVLRTSTKKVRVLRSKIISELKQLYMGKCQICGTKPLDQFETDICEAHHIEYFSISENNDASNIVILCPNHHRLIHSLNPTFVREDGAFEFLNGERLYLKLNFHI